MNYLLALLALATSASAASSTAGFDLTYDTSTLKTLSLSCSDGPNGLSTKGFPTLGSLPNFPNVGAAPTVAGWNSPNCGKCYKVSYSGSKKSIFVVAVDKGDSWVLSKAAMNSLTNGQANALGRVPVTYQAAPNKSCKM